MPNYQNPASMLGGNMYKDRLKRPTSPFSTPSIVGQSQLVQGQHPSPLGQAQPPGSTAPPTLAEQAWEKTAKGLKWLAGAGKSMGTALGKPEVQMALSQLGMAMSKPGEFGHELGKTNIDTLQSQAYGQYASDLLAGREPTGGRILPASMQAQARQQVMAQQAAEQARRKAEMEPTPEEQHKWDIERVGEPARVAGEYAAGRAATTEANKKEQDEIDRAYSVIRSIVSTIDPKLAGADAQTVMDALRQMTNSPQTLRTLEQATMLPEAIKTLQRLNQNIFGLDRFLPKDKFFDLEEEEKEPESEGVIKRVWKALKGE